MCCGGGESEEPRAATSGREAVMGAKVYAVHDGAELRIGSYGTIAEMALALRLGRPVVALAGAPTVDGALVAATPAEAVDLALRDLSEASL